MSAPADIDPDDLVQDALVRFLRLDDPAQVRSVEAFLVTTIVNLAANHRRSWNRRSAALARIGRPQPSPNQYPSDTADLEALPPRERAALYLHHVEGYPFDAVGELLGCSAAAARKAAERGRRRLGAHLEDEK